MLFKKFIIYSKNEASQMNEQVEMLINLDHIISLKPIRISTEDRQVMKAYWIRLSNGKKYKAVSIPNELSQVFDEKAMPLNFEKDSNEVSYQ